MEKKGSDHFRDILNPYGEKPNYGKIGRRRRLSKLTVFFSIILSVTIDRRSTRVLRYTRVLAALGSVVAGILRSCSGYAGLWPWLLAAGPRRQENAKTRVDRRVIPVFCPRWALSWPESCIVVPATAGFWPWLLAAGPPR